MQPRTIPATDEHRANLNLAVAALRFTYPQYLFLVEDVYFDYGQDWMWTTITCRKEGSGYQVLNPKQWEDILTANTTKEIIDVVDSIEIVYEKER